MYALSRPRIALVLLAAPASLLVPNSVRAQESAPPETKTTAKLDIPSTRTALAEWVENARLIQKEKRDWALGKQILSDRIELVKSQIAAMRQKIADAEKSIAETDRKKADLAGENARLRQATSSLEAMAFPLEKRTVALLKRVPVPIREQVKPLSQLIPDPGKKIEAPLGDRFRNVIGILNEINKFNRAIKLTPEVRTLAGGVTAEVATLYLGLGQAYYVTPKGDAAGVGTATADGWVWTPKNDAAEAIARAIAIFQNKEGAGFVPLPITIQ